MDSNDPGNMELSNSVGRCVTKIVAMDVAATWIYDWQATGGGQLILYAQVEPGQPACSAILDIWYRHSKDF